MIFFEVEKLKILVYTKSDHVLIQEKTLLTGTDLNFCAIDKLHIINKIHAWTYFVRCSKPLLVHSCTTFETQTRAIVQLEGMRIWTIITKNLSFNILSKFWTNVLFPAPFIDFIHKKESKFQGGEYLLAKWVTVKEKIFSALQCRLMLMKVQHYTSFSHTSWAFKIDNKMTESLLLSHPDCEWIYIVFYIISRITIVENIISP